MRGKSRPEILEDVKNARGKVAQPEDNGSKAFVAQEQKPTMEVRREAVSPAKSHAKSPAPAATASFAIDINGYWLLGNGFQEIASRRSDTDEMEDVLKLLGESPFTIGNKNLTELLYPAYKAASAVAANRRSRLAMAESSAAKISQI
jgi:uncharacterized Zn finger protein